MAVHGYAKALCDALLVYAVQMENESAKKDFINWVSKYTVLNKREVLIRDARSEHYFSKDDLDKDIYLFNCQNGTLNLKSFEFVPHDSDNLLSKISNVNYKPGMKSERWERFVDEVLPNDKEKVRYFQKLLGYSLTGLTEIEQCFILYGNTTRNGKSTALETYAYMMNNSDGYALTIAPETLAIKLNKDSRHHSSDVARLRGCRFVNASEPPKRMMLDNALIKNWTGGDTIAAREIHEKQMEFKPAFKLFMNTNSLPQITDDTLFTSGRINVITFNRHFKPHEQDKKLKPTLREPNNISGIFNWCLDGLRAYYDEGITPPDSVTNANIEYQISSDKTQQFIDDCLIETPGKHEKAGIVYDEYVHWCQSNGLMSLSKTNFFDELKAKGLFANTGTVDSKTVKNRPLAKPAQIMYTIEYESRNNTRIFG